MDYTIAKIELIHHEKIFITYNASGNKNYIVIHFGDKYWISGKMEREPAKKAFNYYVNRIILDRCGIDIDSMNKARGERMKKEYEERQKAI